MRSLVALVCNPPQSKSDFILKVGINVIITYSICMRKQSRSKRVTEKRQTATATDFMLRKGAKINYI